MRDASDIVKFSFSVNSEGIHIYMMDLIFFLLAKLGLTVLHAGIFFVQAPNAVLVSKLCLSLDSFF